MVVTSSFVTEQREPVLYVSHDHDDEAESGGLRQFHCGNGDYSMSQMQLVLLKTVLQIDPSLKSLANLPVGFEARLAATGRPWVYQPQE